MLSIRHSFLFKIWHAMVFDMAWEIKEWHGELYWNACVANHSHFFIMRWTFVFSVKFWHSDVWMLTLKISLIHAPNCNKIALVLVVLFTETMLFLTVAACSRYFQQWESFIISDQSLGWEIDSQVLKIVWLSFCISLSSKCNKISI